jgi:hypothetical protein
MINWIFKKLDSWAIKTNRKLMLVNSVGDVIMFRYCLLKEEIDRYKTPGAPPNAYIHIWYKENDPDGGIYHNHSSSVLSIMLKGSYDEMIDDKIKIRKPGSLQYMTINDMHRIVRCKKGTVTLFFRWFSTTNMKLKQNPCENVCDWCKTNVKDGKCFTENKEFKYDMFINQFESSKKKGIKTSGWIYCNANGYKWLETRKKAVKRLNKFIPTSYQEANLNEIRELSNLPEMYYTSEGVHDLTVNLRENRKGKK